MSDWIDDWVHETAEVPSPEIYRRWSAITAISGALERKVWTVGSGGHIFPHLYTVLVGPPTSGKTQAIRPVRDMWSGIKGLNLCPDNVTKASMIDVLSRSLRTIVNGNGTPYMFSAVAVACTEFGVFFTHHDLEFLSNINNIFDSPPMYIEERRTAGIIEVNKPHLVMLSGTQPDFLNSFLPEEAWGMGFTSRLIMVYSAAGVTRDLFSAVKVDSDKLLRGLAQIFELTGAMQWSKEAIDEINAWNARGCPPTPTHNRLLHYNGRRPLHVIKLAMIAAVSRNPRGMIVTVEDFERAKDWLLDAETYMPDIFRAMGAKSDIQIIGDLHYNMYMQWSRQGTANRKGISSGDMFKFLHERVPSDKIQRLVDVAVKAGYFRSGAFPDEFIPIPLQQVARGAA